MTKDSIIDRVATIKEVLLDNEQIAAVSIEEKDKEIVAFITPENKAHGYTLNPEKNKTKGWAMVYDISYSKTNKETDPEFNTDLWISNYDGLPIPKVQMQEWVNTTVARILSLPNHKNQPKILEVGCGSGLLLYPLLPHIAEYVGVDNAGEGLKLIQETCTGRKDGEKVKLYLADALSVAELPLGKFDVIVINSVTQYFPSVEYLVAAIKGLQPFLEERGAIFIGDIRCSFMLDAFHTDTLLSKLPADTTVEKLRKKINFKTTRDPESIFNPKLFHLLPKLFSSPVSVQTQLRRGVYHNEMTSFRYDVIMKMSEGIANYTPLTKKITWSKDWSISDIEKLRDEGDADHIVLVDVPNNRILLSAKLMDILPSFSNETTLDVVKKQLQEEMINTVGLEPTDFWNLENETYSVEVDWNFDDPDGKMTVRLLKRTGSDYQHAVNDLLIRDTSNKVAMTDKNELLQKVSAYVEDKLPSDLQPKAIYLLSEDLFELFK